MSSKPLLIVESPSKAKTISKVLGNEYEVLACVGHIKDLPSKELGIDIDNDFQMTLKVLPDRKQFVKELKTKAKMAPKVVIATDPDREGEAIASHIASEILEAEMERVEFTEITPEGIEEGMQHVHLINDHLVKAQRTRRIIDRLVGYKLSPVLWSTLQKNMKFVEKALSAGRVQSAALKMIVDRERLRNKFTSATYFDLKATLLSPDGIPFQAILYRLDEKRLAGGKDFNPDTGQLISPNVVLMNAEEASALHKVLKPGTWGVSSIEEKPQTSRPRPPFTTSTLQQEAARKLRLSARRTMRLAQQLYEAGFITYMRTDSTHLSGEALNAARQEIQRLYGTDYLPEKPVHYTTQVKNAQEAHEAIRPAGNRFAALQTVQSTLGEVEAKLYELIWKRTLASQMNPARLKRTTVSIVNQAAEFRARGKVILFPGYMRVYVEGTDQPDASLADKETILPDLKTGDDLTCESLNVEDHSTKPPARFTEASLVKELEARGIGRPSTFANIIETIQRRNYVTNQKGVLTPTYLAIAVTQLLENHFHPLVDSEFTARMEDNLDSIARGEIEPLPFMKAFYFGQDEKLGLEEMLKTEVDIRKACTIEITTDDEPILARIGNYGPYLTRGDERRSIPASLALGDLTPEKAREVLNADRSTGKSLGMDPESGETILLKEGPYGPYLELEESKKRKSIPQGVDPETVELNYAIDLLSLPRNLGSSPDSGEEILADYGRYGPYLKMGKTHVKLRPPVTPLNVTLDQAIDLLKKKSQGSVEIRQVGPHPETGETLIIKDGRYGPYVTDGKVNASLPKEADPQGFSLEEARELIDKRRAAGPRKKRRRRK